MGGHFDLRSDHPRTVFSATIVSFALHGSLLAALFGGAQTMIEPSQLLPLRFSGQTFDVDTLGEVAEHTQHPASALAPSGSLALDAQAAQDNAPQDNTSASSLTIDSEHESEHIVPVPLNAAPEKVAVNVERASLPKSSSQRNETLAIVDPFDLTQLPGEPVRTDALHPSQAAYGAESTSTVVIDVFAAFLRKFPEAAKNEPSWESLAPGFAGRIEFVVTLEEGERGLTLTIDKSLPAPSYLKSSVLRTTSFLRHSHLAWRDGAAGGTQRLSLTARVERRKAGSRTPYAEGILAFGIHGEHQPNSAFFTYASGQHIEIELQRIP